jgi:hypothetical protein
MKDKIGKIYGLIDPRYGIIRYCGQTVNTIEKRFEGHLKELNGKSHKVNWIRKLLSLGLKPKLVLLAYDILVPFITYLQNGDKFKPFYDYDALDKEEKLFISISKEECAAFGIDCVNGNNGGNGEHSQNMTTVSWCKGLSADPNSPNYDTRVERGSIKQRGKKLSEETIEKIRVAIEGTKNPQHSEQMKGSGNPMFGISPQERMTPEVYERYRANHAGYKNYQTRRYFLSLDWS